MSVEPCEGRPCAGTGCSHDQAFYELVQDNHHYSTDAHLMRETMLALLIRAERGALTPDHAPLLRQHVELEISRADQAEAELRATQARLSVTRALLASAGLASEGTHVYLSTSCLHERHDYCASSTGFNETATWVKSPSVCGFCSAPCICMCHRGT